MTAEQDFERWLDKLSNEIICDQSISQLKASRRKQLLDSGHLSDVVLICDERKLKCHRVILVENSPVFEAMFMPNFREGTDTEIEIKDLSYDILLKAIEYLYTGSIDVSPNELLSMLKFADMYDVTPLRTICGDTMIKYITVSSAISIWQYTKRYQATSAAKLAKSYCVSNFYPKTGEQVCTTNGFYGLDEDGVVELLSDPLLQASNENDIFEALLEWFFHKQDDSCDILHRVLHICIQTHNIGTQVIAQMLQRVSNAVTSPQFSVFMLRLMTDIQLKSPLNVSSFLTPRIKTDTIDCLTVAFTCHQSGENHRVLLAALYVDAQYKYKMTCLKQADSLRQPIGIHSDDKVTNRIWITDGNLRLLVFDSKADTWAQRTLTAGFNASFPIFSHDGKIFNIAWKDDKKKLAIDELKDDGSNWKSKWDFEAPIRLTNLDFVTYFKNYIFIFEPENNRVVAANTITHVVTTQGLNITAPNTEEEKSIFTNVNAGRFVCLVSLEFIHVIFLDRLIRLVSTGEVASDAPEFDAKSRGMAPHSANEDHISEVSTVIFKPLKGPGGHDKIHDAAVYGNQLVVWQAPSNAKSAKAHTFKCTDINKIINAKDKDEAVWQNMDIEMDSNTTSYFTNNALLHGRFLKGCMNNT